MRVIAGSGLKRFWERPGCADARGPLRRWYEEALEAKWRGPQDIKDQYASASICGNNRVVLDVGGSKYRPVVEVQYQAEIVRARFVGAHAQYDRIDAESIGDALVFRDRRVGHADQWVSVGGGVLLPPLRHSSHRSLITSAPTVRSSSRPKCRRRIRPARSIRTSVGVPCMP